MNFEENLGELVTRLKSANEPEKKRELKEGMKTIVQQELCQTEDTVSFVRVVSRHNHHYHIIAEAIFNELSQKPSETSDNLFRLLKADTESALIYQLLARFLSREDKQLGLKWLAYICNKITANGSKKPSTKALQRLRNALLLTHDLKEKPLEAILGDDALDRGLVVALIALIGISGEEDKTSVNDMILRQMILRKAATTWSHLTGKEQLMFGSLVKDMLGGKNLSHFFRLDAEPNLGSDFLSAVGMAPGSPLLTVEKESDTLGMSASLAGKDMPKDRDTEHDRRVTKQHSQELMQAEQMIATLLGLIGTAKQRMQKLTDSNLKLDESSIELSVQVDHLEKEKAELQDSLARRDTELAGIKIELVTTRAEYENRIERIIKASEDSRRDEIQQFRNRIVRDLRPIIQDMFSLDNIPDHSERYSLLIDLLQSMLRTLKSTHGLEIVHE
jgi:hypothetical protein